MTSGPETGIDPVATARRLLRTRRQGALATLAMGSGDPYCSLVNVATAMDGAPILLISRLARHTGNLSADPRVSLMLDERPGGEALAAARVMLGGEALRAEADALPAIRARYLAAHPAAELFVDFPDFAFFRLRLQNVHLVAGFGAIADMPPESLLSELSDAAELVAAHDDIVAHMNADHRDTMSLYAERLLAAPPGVWQCCGCDPDGLDLRTDDGSTARLEFPQRVTSPRALRQVLKALADDARQAETR